MKIICYLFAIAFSCSLVGCGKIELPLIKNFSIPEIRNVGFDSTNTRISEVAPPNIVRQLDRNLEKYQPKVSIVIPQSDTTLQDNTVKIVLAVRDYPLFKDETLGMGPHLNLIVDNEHYAEIYDLEQPIIIKDLKPGTHSLRVLAEKPWHESFKNPEAFTYSTFNVLTETKDNIPNLDLPLLTYNQPSGVYNTEPILLDFYLTGIDTENWQIKATINEESFAIDELQPIYLQGFQEGNNLIKLELLDSDGLAIENQFNQPIRLINYDATNSSRETLARLVTDRISFEEAVAITQQNYDVLSVEETSTPEPTTRDLLETTPAEDIKTVEEPTTEDLSKTAPIEDTQTVEEPTTEDLSKTAPVEEPTTEDLFKTAPVEEPTTEDLSRTAPAANIIEEAETAEELINPSKKAFEAPKVTDITTVSKVNKIEEPENIFAEDSINKDNISTTTVAERNNLLIEKSSKIENTETSIPEDIRTVETEDNLIASNIEEPNTITIEIPKPKLKIPQWWRNFVAYLQERFNNV